MKNINHRQIRMISEDLNPYDTTIVRELPMPKFITDKHSRLFQKAKTVFESGNSRVLYHEVPVVALSSVEVSPGVVIVNYEVAK